MNSCMICNKAIGAEESDYVQIRNEGAVGINNASEARGQSIYVSAGDFVHISCRKWYINKADIASCSSQEDSTSITRSRVNTFNFRTNCFLCGDFITIKEQQERPRIYANVSSGNREVDTAIEKYIADRNEDEWAIAVKGRLASILCLRAEEAVYHLSCNARFRNKKRHPKSTVIGEKRGRPPDLTREAAFIEVATYLKENDEEQLTLSDLTAMMANMLPEGENNPYCNKWLQEKLSYFKDQIVISYIQGIPNVVTFLSTANKILSDFRNDQSSEDANEKLRVIQAAAELIKNDIKILPPQGLYPTVAELGSLEGCLEYVPLSLRTLLEYMFVGKEKSVKVSFIGQAIMQQVRPRVFLAPLQIGVAVQMHHQFASRFLNDTLNAMGFASSYSEVSKFE